MRNILLATVALAALSGSAIAGDLPSRKDTPVYVAPVSAFSWTGLYVGIEGGADFLNTTAYNARLGNTAYDRTGGLLGGVVGYNYEFANRFVFGLEGDAGGVFGARKTDFASATFADSSYFANIRGRLGYAFADRALLYTAGGVAFGDIKGVLVSQDRVGWTIGAGVDYAFTNNWIGRVEYRYTDLGKSDIFGTPVSQTSNAVLVGLLYKFGGPDYAPVVGRY